jgi:chemosensory pili system protein ChpA (sensor histidine kinase/response regulator)
MTARASHHGTMLSWVREDLDRHMDQTRLQIEHLAGVPAVSKEAILETAGKLDQLRLTLETLALPGAGLVATEMMALCERLGKHRVDNRDKAFGALMDAVVILPSYLDRLQAGHHDLPMLLLPTINRLRNAHNASLLQENALFTPSLDVELPELQIDAGKATAREAFSEFTARMRGQFESALLNWLQEQDSIDLLSPLQGICETLMHRVQRKDLRRMWWVASEVVGGLLDGFTENDPHLRRLFARLHLALKKVSEGGGRTHAGAPVPGGRRQEGKCRPGPAEEKISAEFAGAEPGGTGPCARFGKRPEPGNVHVTGRRRSG